MLPIGAQLVGSWWSEARLLELAAAIENMRLARQ
jgi:Asp-tRNA(Asn)/Glu-tRNA(Gln) amidotransferase A subunit family amidase